MTDLSVNAIRIPRLRSDDAANSLAKAALCRLLRGLRVGSMTIYDAGETLRFGSPENPHRLHAEVRIHNPLAWRQVMLGGGIGSGEAYMQGYWSSPDLLQVVRVFTANLDVLASMDARQPAWKRAALAVAHALNNNSPRGSRRNIAAHYDLGNEFFELFLDSRMMYSSAIFPHRGADLETAAEHKLERICEQLKLQPTDHLLEIGTGWGGMAVYAAGRYGCKVTTTTISREQFEYASERVRREGLEDRVTVLCRDYRELEGRFDKLVSIEMIEAVGHKYYRSYFRKCGELLKPDGLMAIQAITVPDQRFDLAKNNVDFIKRYIFPGGCLPSIEAIAGHLRRDTDMRIVDLFDITEHYAETLDHWARRFFDRLEQVREQGFDTTFQRMWEFYLRYCEGGFRERSIGAVQLTFAKPGHRFV